MTPEDKQLPQDVLRTPGPLRLYRIARLKYANLSGAGSALYPGRWNRLGQEAIYTSTDPGTPVLEHFAHLPKNVIPSNLAMMEILLDRRGPSAAETNETAVAGSGIIVYPTLKFARERHPFIPWTKYPGMIAIAVPSVIAPSWNVVLYPQKDGFFDRVSLHSVESFEYDPRLFPENTPLESK